MKISKTHFFRDNLYDYDFLRFFWPTIVIGFETPICDSET